MRKYNFNGDKYVTSGIKNELPAVIMSYIWGLIEEKKNDRNFVLDYLQVFELIVEELNHEKWLVITHSQEQPEEFRQKHYLKKFSAIAGKIFVIDDIDHVTMLWSYEY